MSQRSRKVSDEKDESPVSGGSFSSMGTFGMLMDTGWRVAIPILVIMLGGIFLDRALSTEPLFILISVPLSMAAAAWLVYKQLQALKAAQASRRAQR